MSRARIGWDWMTDRTYPPHGGSLPPVDLAQHHHLCPDGTPVAVTAQFITTIQVTLLRWKIGGESAGTTSVPGRLAGSPDWSNVDGEHPVTQGSAA